MPAIYPIDLIEKRDKKRRMDRSIIKGWNVHYQTLAEVEEEGEIKNVWNGTWLYWIEPGQQTDLAGLARVRAEMYRVNDALTNEGQRLVSDSLFENMPATLPEIELGK